MVHRHCTKKRLEIYFSQNQFCSQVWWAWQQLLQALVYYPAITNVGSAVLRLHKEQKNVFKTGKWYTIKQCQSGNSSHLHFTRILTSLNISELLYQFLQLIQLHYRTCVIEMWHRKEIIVALGLLQSASDRCTCWPLTLRVSLSSAGLEISLTQSLQVFFLHGLLQQRNITNATATEQPLSTSPFFFKATITRGKIRLAFRKPTR